MKPLDFEYWPGRDGYTPASYSTDEIAGMSKLSVYLALVNYHHNYMRLRRRIEELEAQLNERN